MSAKTFSCGSNLQNTQTQTEKQYTISANVSGISNYKNLSTSNFVLIINSVQTYNGRHSIVTKFEVDKFL